MDRITKESKRAYDEIAKFFLCQKDSLAAILMNSIREYSSYSLHTIKQLIGEVDRQQEIFEETDKLIKE